MRNELEDGKCYSAYRRQWDVLTDYRNKNNPADHRDLDYFLKGRQLFIYLSERESFMVNFDHSRKIESVIFRVLNTGYNCADRIRLARHDAEMLDAYFRFDALYEKARSEATMNDLIIVTTNTARPNWTGVVATVEYSATAAVAGLSAEGYQRDSLIHYAGRFSYPPRVLEALQVALSPNCSMPDELHLHSVEPARVIAILKLSSKDELTSTIREEYERKFNPDDRYATHSKQ